MTRRRIINEKGRADEIQPAARLVIAVLTLAAREFEDGDGKAAAFIGSPDFDFWCTLIGANPSYLRRRIELEMPPQRKGAAA